MKRLIVAYAPAYNENNFTLETINKMPQILCSFNWISPMEHGITKVVQ